MIGGQNMLGAGVDPRLFSYDFSGAYKIGENYAKGISSLGEAIAKGIEGTAELKKQGNLFAAQKRADAAYIDSAINIYKDKDPERVAQLQTERSMMDDPALSLEQQTMVGKSLRQSVEDAIDLNYKAARMFKAQGQAGGNGGSYAGAGASGGGEGSPSQITF